MNEKAVGKPVCCSIQNGVCRYNPSEGLVGDTGFHDIPSGDEDALSDAVSSVGPISVAMDASHASFQVMQ